MGLFPRLWELTQRSERSLQRFRFQRTCHQSEQSDGEENQGISSEFAASNPFAFNRERRVSPAAGAARGTGFPVSPGD